MHPVAACLAIYQELQATMQLASLPAEASKIRLGAVVRIDEEESLVNLLPAINNLSLLTTLLDGGLHALESNDCCTTKMHININYFLLLPSSFCKYSCTASTLEGL